jgi:hypothetical protein
LLQGTLDLLILKAIGQTELHALGVSRRIERITRETTSSEAGLCSRKTTGVRSRLTKAGHCQVEVEAKEWTTIAQTIAAALQSV